MSKIKGKPRMDKRLEMAKKVDITTFQPEVGGSKVRGKAKKSETPRVKSLREAQMQAQSTTKSPSRILKASSLPNVADRPLQYQPPINEKRTKRGTQRPQSQSGRQEQESVKAKKSLEFGADKMKSQKLPPTKFVPKSKGETEMMGKVVALYDIKERELLQEASKYVDKLAVVLERTSFCCENEYCGQLSSLGKIILKLNHFQIVFQVKDVQEVDGYYLHIGRVISGKIEVGTSMICKVDYDGMERKLAKLEQLQQPEEEAEPESKYSQYPSNIPWVENKPEPEVVLKGKPMWTAAGLLEAGTGRTKECDDPIFRQLPDEPQNPGGKKAPSRTIWTSAGPMKLTMKQQADLPLLRQLPEFHQPRMIWTSYGPIPEYEMKEVTAKTPMADRPLLRQPPIHNQAKKFMYTSFGPIEIKETPKPLVKPKRPAMEGSRISLKKGESKCYATVLIVSGDELYISYDDQFEPEWVKRKDVKVGRTIMTSEGPIGIYDDPSKHRDIPTRGSRVFMPKGGGNPRTDSKEWGTVLCQVGESYSFVQFDDLKFRPAWVTSSSITYIRPNTGPRKRIDPSKFAVTKLVHVPHKASYTWAEIKSVSDGCLELIHEDGSTGWAVMDSVLATPLPRESIFFKMPKIQRKMLVMVIERRVKPDEPAIGRLATVTDVDFAFQRHRLLNRTVGAIVENLGDRFMDGKYMEVEYKNPKKRATEWRNMGAVLRVFTEKPMPMDPMDANMLKPGMRVKIPKNSGWQWATINEIEEPWAEVKYDDRKLEPQWVAMSTFKHTCHVTGEDAAKLPYSSVCKKRRPRKMPTTIKEKSRRVSNKSPLKLIFTSWRSTVKTDMLTKKAKHRSLVG